MKKFLALMIAVVMAFSMVAVPASAADVAADLEKVETTLNDAFDYIENLMENIHALVGGILAVFDKECPFCEEIHKSAPVEPDEPVVPDEPVEPEEPEIVLPAVPENFPAKVEAPADAVVVATVEGLADAIANAEDGAYIVLADGTYDEIVVTKSNITLAANDATVGFINLNGKSNITLVNIKFDAAGAKEAIKANSTASTGILANIVGTQTPVKSNGHDITIKNCTFAGTAAKAGSYTPIFVNDQKRSGAHAYNYTVDGCLFEVSAAYYVYLNYLQKGTITMKNNFFGGKDYICNGIFWASSNGSNLVVEDNIAYNWTGGAAIGTSRSGASYAMDVKVRNNTFVQVAETATNTDYVHLKNYKTTDTFDVVNSLNNYVGAITAENANVFYDNLV